VNLVRRTHIGTLKILQLLIELASSDEPQNTNNFAYLVNMELWVRRSDHFSTRLSTGANSMQSNAAPGPAFWITAFKASNCKESSSIGPVSRQHLPSFESDTGLQPPSVSKPDNLPRTHTLICSQDNAQ
jgi:hypothetical protein